MDCPTIPEVTIDFLATLEFRYENPSTPTPSQGRLFFKVGRQAYTLSIAELCQAYGLRAEARKVEFPAFKKANELWDLISKEDYKANTAKIKRVRNPVLRYTLKLIANTFSGRSVAPTVTKTELCFLFQGLKHLVSDPDENEDPIEDELGDEVNYGCVLAASLVKYKAYALRCKASSSYIGGFLTPLFVQAGVPIHDYAHVPTRAFMDEAYMRNTDSLGRTPAEGFYAYLFIDEEDKERVCILPNKDETELLGIGNIEFLPTEEECFAPLGGQPAAAIEPRPRSESPGTEDEMPEAYTLPKLDFEPRTKTEKFLASVVEMQRKINKWQGKMLKKLGKKVRQLQGGQPKPASSHEVHQPEKRRLSTGGIVIRENQGDNTQPARHSLQEPGNKGKAAMSGSSESPSWFDPGQA